MYEQDRNYIKSNYKSEYDNDNIIDISYLKNDQVYSLDSFSNDINLKIVNTQFTAYSNELSPEIQFSIPQ